ncbi:hypothetical protein L195_g018037, partial [Trifolium pratense]
MATPTNDSVFVLVYYNGEVDRNEHGVFFQSDETKAFMISTQSTLAHLKERIVKKVNLGDNKVISCINYRIPVFFGSGNTRFESVKIEDDEDVRNMFDIHSKIHAIVSIELCVTFDEDDEDVHSSHPQNTSPQIRPQLTPPQFRPQHASHFHSQPSSSKNAPYTQFRPQLTSPQFRPQHASHFHSQPSSSKNAPYTQFRPQLISPQFRPQLTSPHFHSQPSSSKNAPYTRFHPQETSPHFHSQSSSSSSFTFAPYAQQEDEEESSTPQEEPSTQKDVGDESDNDLDFYEQLFGNDDDYEDDEEDEESQHCQQPSPLREAYNPPNHMRNLDLEIIDQPTETLRLPQSLPVDAGIEAGMQFHDKADCVRAIRHYHIKQSLDYAVKQSDSDRYVIKCVHPQCPFSLRASYRKKSERWVIGRISSHTCASLVLSHDHRKLDANVICDSIVSLVRNDISVKMDVIIAHIKERFNCTITYRKAWIAKNKAIEKIYGGCEQSYHDLPQWLMVMQSYLPGTVVQMETLPAAFPNGSHCPGDMIFHRLFWAFHLCIKGFPYCKPIVQVDGTWLYGKYKGTLLIAVTHDGNNNIFPLAFAIVEGQTKDAWSFFLKNLRRHVTPQPNICLISDCNPSIKSAYDNPENGWNDPPSTHVYCLRHIAINFMREIKDKQLRETVVNMGYAINEPLFRKYHDEIRLNNLEALRWIDNIPREKWTRAYGGGCRWGHMTTNIYETMNFVLNKDTRHRPITSLVQSTYYSCGPLFATRGRQAATMLDSGQDYTEQCKNQITDAVHKASTHQVVQFDQ